MLNRSERFIADDIFDNLDGFINWRKSKIFLKQHFKRIIYNREKLKSIKNDNSFGGCKEFKIRLPPGSILFMGGETQKYYSHEIQKIDQDISRGSSSSSSSYVDEVSNDAIRYSLTFRQYK